MKLKQETKIVALLLCIVSVIVLVCCQLPSFSTVSASATTSIELDENDIAKIKAYTEDLNYTLAEYDTNADEQLEKLGNELVTRLGQTTDGNQITNLTTMKRFANRLRASSISTYSVSDDIDDILHDTALGTVNEIERMIILEYLSPAIAVLAVLGHELTIELLVQGIMSQDVSEPYIPVNGYKVKQSEAFKNIASGSETSGSCEFPNAFWDTAGDLYLSIHWFNYYKPSSPSKTVTITDRYDYKDTDEELGKFPSMYHSIIKGICNLERKGVFTFYDIEITEALPENLNVLENYGYTEIRPYLRANELKDYEVSFTSSGRRLIQTFGDSETKLYILNEKGKTLASANGNGFNGNSLLSYYFEKNTKYVLRIKFADKSKDSDIKLSVICDKRNASSFEGLKLSTLDVGNYRASATKNNVYLAKIVPEETKYYTIEFATDALFRAFLICVSSTDIYSGAYCTSLSGTNSVDVVEGIGSSVGTYAMKDPVISLLPDLGGGDPNTIAKSLTAGKQYLLIVCACPANTSSLNVSFTISKS